LLQTLQHQTASLGLKIQNWLRANLDEHSEGSHHFQVIIDKLQKNIKRQLNFTSETTSNVRD
jgi:hypothetical protein